MQSLGNYYSFYVMYTHIYSYHRMVRVGRDLEEHLVPTSLS